MKLKLCVCSDDNCANIKENKTALNPFQDCCKTGLEACGWVVGCKSRFKDCSGWGKFWAKLAEEINWDVNLIQNGWTVKKD